MSEIGHIDCGYLPTIQAMMDRIWADPIANIDLIADVEAAKAVLENQQVKFSEITGRKKRIMSLEWLTKCIVETTPCTDDCEIDGEDVVPECKEYEIECLRESTFKVPERAYRERTIEEQEAIALNLLLAKKALDEWLAQYIVTGLVAAGGTNAYTGGIGHVDVAETHIAANFWDDNIWSYFNLVNAYNKYRSPYLLTGVNLHQYLFNRMHESMTEAGRAAMSKIGTIRRIYQDIVNVEAIAPGYTFLINKTAVAFVNKAWYPLGASNAERKAGIYSFWSEASNNIPGIYYDVEMMETCLNNEFYKAFKVQLHGLFAENPYPCDETNTGVLAFVCGGQ
jgi:hypothetical protein